MLIDFTVKNYLSFRDEVTLSLLASNSMHENAEPHALMRVDSGKYELLPVSIVYGPNASGKSNLIKAFQTFRTLVLKSHNLDLDSAIPAYKPFALNEESSKAPVLFSAEFVISDARYLYTVEFEKYKILKEELYFYPEGRKAKLFAREGKNFSWGIHFKGEKHSIANICLENNLFLSKAANSAHEKMGEVYRYFKNNFILHLSMDSSDKPFHNTTKKLLKSPNEFKSALLGLLNAADFNVSDIRVDRNPDAEKYMIFEDGTPEDVRESIIEDFSRKPMLGHPIYRNGSQQGVHYFDLGREESTGTLKIYDLAGAILHALATGSVLLIDEFNSGLHSHLSQMIIEFFSNPQLNHRNAQLIVVTHDTCTMDSRYLRRDEIWFTDKDDEGGTELFSLSEFDKNIVRKGANYSKMYHDGRFQAVPSIRQFWHEYLQGKSIEESNAKTS